MLANLLKLVPYCLLRFLVVTQYGTVAVIQSVGTQGLQMSLGNCLVLTP